jgi:hypothetical protein
MKARNVSVSVVDFGHEGLYVMVTMKLPGHNLSREASHPSGDMYKGVRVSEASRKQKMKELQKILESLEFPDA